MTKMTKFDLVSIVWHDAHADLKWMDITEVDNEPYVVTSVGFLLPKAKKGHHSIGQSLGAEGFADSILHIPNKMIVSSTIITPADSV